MTENGFSFLNTDWDLVLEEQIIKIKVNSGLDLCRLSCFGRVQLRVVLKSPCVMLDMFFRRSCRKVEFWPITSFAALPRLELQHNPVLDLWSQFFWPISLVFTPMCIIAIPYRARRVSFKIMSSQFHLLELDASEGVEICQRWSRGIFWFNFFLIATKL